MINTLLTGPLSVWNGQAELAKISNDAGEWPHGEQGGLLGNMFDGDLETFWHSASNTVNNPKTITIEFKVNKNAQFERLKNQVYRLM